MIFTLYSVMDLVAPIPLWPSDFLWTFFRSLRKYGMMGMGPSKNDVTPETCRGLGRGYKNGDFKGIIGLTIRGGGGLKIGITSFMNGP